MTGVTFNPSAETGEEPITMNTRVRSAAPTSLFAEGSSIDARANGRGEAFVISALPGIAGLVAQGNSWSLQIVAANAFTFVAALPTTLANLYLYNNDANKSYVIDAVWLYAVTSMAAAQPVVQLAQVIPPAAAAAPTNAPTTSFVSSMSGRGVASGPTNMLRSIADTKAVANYWQVLEGPVNLPMTTNLGTALFANVQGRYIVPPKGAFAVNAVAGTAAGTAIQGVIFHEVLLDIVQ